ncbi:MAG TPA: FtsQ-type POTRA domain-containing protein [Terriglobales bacterium]|jgi:cell division protein FtsQ|nr:FtsQ-type POTRA domain-containing protein [Terriglobales bacterium]
MARKSGPTISQEELYPPSDEAVRPDVDEARVLDLDADEESPFLRGQKRVSARRGSLPKKTAKRLTWIGMAAGILVLVAVAGGFVYRYGKHSWRFRIASSDDIEIAGLKNVTKAQVMEVMGGDIGRNIFFVPLAQRKEQIEQIPWVESASVMRFLPERLKVEIQERTPAAFARVGSKILLIDPSGTLMDLPANDRGKYSFPVIIGTNPGEPPSTRLARMKIYADVIGQLDSGGGRYSQELSEVDLTDPDDVKVMADSPQGEVLIHLGSSDYLDRYKIYVSHIREWRQQFDKLESVDLRYDRQIIVNPDLGGAAKPTPLAASAAKAAMAAGVKPAALVTHYTLAKGPKAVVPLSAKAAAIKPVTKKKAGPTRAHHLVRAKPTPHVKKAVAKTLPPKPKPVVKSKKPSPGIAKYQD